MNIEDTEKYFNSAKQIHSSHSGEEPIKLVPTKPDAEVAEELKYAYPVDTHTHPC